MIITREFMEKVSELTMDCHDICNLFGRMKVDVSEVDLLKIARAFAALGSAASDAASKTLNAHEIKTNKILLEQMRAKHEAKS